MPLLDVTNEELLLLRNLADSGIATWAAHQRATKDVYVEAAIGVQIADALELRKKIVEAGKVFPWEVLKARMDAMQAADPEAPAFTEAICAKHHQAGCVHCQTLGAHL